MLKLGSSQLILTYLLFHYNVFFSVTKIFSEKPVFETGPKIDAKNQNYVKKGGDVKVYISYSIYHSKFQVLKYFYKKIFTEKPVFEAGPKIDAKNSNYVKPSTDIKV